MRFTTPTSHSMVGEADQTLNAADKPTGDENKSDSGIESDALVASSSSNMAAAKVTDKIVPDMSDY
jgi:hypothetical protein